MPLILSTNIPLFLSEHNDKAMAEIALNNKEDDYKTCRNMGQY